MGTGATQTWIADELGALVDLPREQLEILAEPMVWLVLIQEIGRDYGRPKGDEGPRLSGELFDALVAATEPGTLTFMGYPVVTGYDVLATHVDPPPDNLFAKAPSAAPPIVEEPLPIERTPDGGFLVRTEGCRLHGHPEVVLRWSRAAIPEPHALVRFFVTSVQRGTRFRPGETLLLGGRTTRFVAEGDALALEERDHAGEQPVWRPGVDRTLWELAIQRFTAGATACSTRSTSRAWSRRWASARSRVRASSPSSESRPPDLWTRDGSSRASAKGTTTRPMLLSGGAPSTS